MKPRQHNPAYATQVLAKGWQIVIPISGKLAPIVWQEGFPSKQAADQWLSSKFGREFVAKVQSERRLSGDYSGTVHRVQADNRKSN